MTTNRQISCAVVTGATRGIGKAVACALAPISSAIVAVARNETELGELAKEIGSDWPACRIATIAGDVAEAQTAARAVKAADELGGCDALVNSAGIFPPALLAEITAEHVQQVMRVNFHGTLNFCQAIAPGMTQRQMGRIVNLTSIAARSPTPGLSVYAASKAAVEAFSRSIAAELAPHVQVNCVSPGPTMTEAVRALVQSDTTGAVEAVSRSIPLGRYGDPTEVAEAVRFLIESKASNWMTGQVVQVNGGQLMA